jgi:hypothetical protein
MKDARVLGAIVPVVLLAAAAQAQSLEMNWFTIDSGGVSMSGANNLTLDGTVGQPDAGPMSGGGFELAGGFWGQLDEPSCWANCDNSTIAPVLNVLDFSCFLNKFAAGDAYANCDNSTVAPVLNVLDFACFLNKFAAGCP